MKQKNEAGYTLVLVLLTITLIFIFSLTLINNVLNSATQNKKTEQDIQLNKSSQMGVTYVEKAINKASDQARKSVITWLNSSPPPNPTPDNNDIANKYESEFRNQLLNEEIISADNKYRFKVGDISITRAATTMTVKYIITPSLNNEYAKKDPVREKTINVTITQSVAN